MDNDHHEPRPAGEKAEIIAQPVSLRDKISLVPEGDPDPIEAADQAVADQADTYLDNARDQLVELRETFDGSMAEPTSRPDALRGIFTVAHNLKGQGKSFGYDMITDIAASLCEILRDRTEIGESGMKVVKIHIDALGVVFDHDLRGDGGTQGRMLLDRLSGLAGSRAG